MIRVFQKPYLAGPVSDAHAAIDDTRAVGLLIDQLGHLTRSDQIRDRNRIVDALVTRRGIAFGYRREGLP